MLRPDLFHSAAKEHPGSPSATRAGPKLCSSTTKWHWKHKNFSPPHRAVLARKEEGPLTNMGKSEHAHKVDECLNGIIMLPSGIHQPHQHRENELPAMAGLHHAGFLYIFTQSISVLDHLLLSPGHASPPSTAASSPGTPHVPAQPWHHAISPRCAVVVLNSTFHTANVLIFTQCSPLFPPASSPAWR